MDSRIKKTKKLFFSFLLVSSCNIGAFNLQEYSTFYNSGKNSAEESLINVENNVWKMSSKIEHSIFQVTQEATFRICLLYTSPSPRDLRASRMPSSA